MKALAALMMLTCLACMCSDAATVTLPAKGAVSGPRIKLGDIAKIEGDGADALAEVDLGPAASPASSRRIEAAFIPARAKLIGIAPASIQMQGAATIEVGTLHNEVTRDMVVDSLREFIETNMPAESRDTDIEINCSVTDMVMPDGDVSFEWRVDPNYKYAGPAVFRGNVLISGKNRKAILCRVDIKTYSPVVTASTNIPKGKVITAGDLKTETQPLCASGETLFLDPADAAGLVAQRNIAAGEVVTRTAVTPPTVVKRNQAVTVVAIAGGLEITTQARAATDGAEGDVVKCFNVGSKETFEGMVRKDGVVVVQ